MIGKSQSLGLSFAMRAATLSLAPAFPLTRTALAAQQTSFRSIHITAAPSLALPGLNARCSRGLPCRSSLSSQPVKAADSASLPAAASFHTSNRVCSAGGIKFDPSMAEAAKQRVIQALSERYLLARRLEQDNFRKVLAICILFMAVHFVRQKFFGKKGEL